MRYLLLLLTTVSLNCFASLPMSSQTFGDTTYFSNGMKAQTFGDTTYYSQDPSAASMY